MKASVPGDQANVQWVTEIASLTPRLSAWSRKKPPLMGGFLHLRAVLVVGSGCVHFFGTNF